MEMTRPVFWIIRVIVYCLKIAGLAPFSFGAAESTRNSRQACIGTFQFSKAGFAYNLFLSILFTAITTIIYLFLSTDNFHGNNTVSHLIFLIRFLTSTFSTCAIVILYTFRQRSAVYVWNRLLEVGAQISSLKMPRGKTIAILTLHLIINIVTWITYGVTEIIVNPADNLILGSVRIIISYVIYWFIVEYAIAVVLIARGLETINTNLLNLEKSSCYVSRSMFVNDFLQACTSQILGRQLAVLRSLIRIRVELFEISKEVEDFFSFPILCLIVSTFTAIVRESHRFVSAPSTSLLPLSGFIMYLSIQFYPVVLLSANVSKTMKTAKMTALIVRRILTSVVDREMKAELEQFSLQLLHNDFTFDACGFFSLDFTVINWIIGGTMTYLIISVQFEMN